MAQSTSWSKTKHVMLLSSVRVMSWILHAPPSIISYNHPWLPRHNLLLGQKRIVQCCHLQIIESTHNLLLLSISIFSKITTVTIWSQSWRLPYRAHVNVNKPSWNHNTNLSIFSSNWHLSICPSSLFLRGSRLIAPLHPSFVRLSKALTHSDYFLYSIHSSACRNQLCRNRRQFIFWTLHHWPLTLRSLLALHHPSLPKKGWIRRWHRPFHARPRGRKGRANSSFPHAKTKMVLQGSSQSTRNWNGVAMPELASLFNQRSGMGSIQISLYSDANFNLHIVLRGVSALW